MKKRANAPPAFQMNSRDLAILRAVSRHVMLDRRLIENLFFLSDDGRRTNTNRARERLRLLWQHGYLIRIQRPIYTLDPIEGSKGPAYRLSLKAAELLAEMESAPVSKFNYSYKARLHPMSIDHGLAVAETRIAFEQKAGANGPTIETSLNEAELRRTGWDSVTVTGEGRGREKITIAPDSYFALSTPKGKVHFFLEVDRSTESVSRIWRRKIRGYKAYVTSGKFHKRYGVAWPDTPLRILVIAPSLDRTKNLKSAAERYGPPRPSRMFLFAVMSELLSRNPYKAPIWLRAGDNGRFAIFETAS